jgi:hypothetical protein
MDYYGKESTSSNKNKLLPIILLAASAAAIVAMFILPFLEYTFSFSFYR